MFYHCHYRYNFNWEVGLGHSKFVHKSRKWDQKEASRKSIGMFRDFFGPRHFRKNIGSVLTWTNFDFECLRTDFFISWLVATKIGKWKRNWPVAILWTPPSIRTQKLKLHWAWIVLGWASAWDSGVLLEWVLLLTLHWSEWTVPICPPPVIAKHWWSP